MNAKIKRGLALVAVGLVVALVLRATESATDPAPQFLNVVAAAALWAGLALVGWGLITRRSRPRA